MPESSACDGQVPIQLPIRWDTPVELPTMFATNLIVQRTAETFTISFFEIRPPILLGTPEQNQSTLSELKEVVAHCVVRVVVTPERMKEFVGVLNTSYEAWQRDKEQMP